MFTWPHLTPKRSLLCAVLFPTLLTIVGGCGFSDGNEVSDKEVAEAHGMIAETKGKLVKTLMASMESAGPAQSLDTCRLQAPSIMKEAAEQGYEIGRTTHQLRNPKNAPVGELDEWLNFYEKAKNDTAGHAAITETGHVLYAEPLYIKPLCLTCHGDNIASDVQSELDRLYPDDKAVGYKEGDFRGLIWVKF